MSPRITASPQRAAQAPAPTPQGATSAPGPVAGGPEPHRMAAGPPPKALRPCNPGRASIAAPMAGRLKAAAKVCGASFEAVAGLFECAREGRALSFDDARATVDGLLANLEEDREALLSFVRLKSHDDYACMHSVAVCVLMTCLGRQLGFDALRVRQAAMAGLLHDIGKAFISTGLLQKPERFTSEEHKLVQGHTLFGYEALGQMEGIEEAVREVALHHHERPDGNGYPHGLQGEQIPVFARMGAICDVYDAVTSNRPYKDGSDPGFALERMLKWTQAGQFDVQVMAAFQQMMGTYPIGSLVRLQSQRLAVVNGQRPGQPLRPCVTTFYCTRTDALLAPEIVDLAQPHERDAIAAAESNGVWRFDGLDTLWANDLAGGIHHAGYLPLLRPAGILC